MKRATARKTQQEELDFSGGDKPPPRRRRGAPQGGGGGGGDGVPAPLHEEARRRYLNYALSVITSRALPDVRDGLKPVQRRIVFGMYTDHRLTHEAKYQKCAKVVGTTGIAVGMATNIPPHNVQELCDALAELIAHPKQETKDLLKFIKGPDFPTGGQLLNSRAELRQIYETGQGSLRVRGEWKMEELPRGGQQIVVTSISYAVNKSSLVAKFGDLVRERKLPPLVDVPDESTKDVRIVLELKRDADADLVMAYLYKHTSLETNFNVNMTALVPTSNVEVGTPQRLGLKEILRYFLDFRFQVVTRRFQFDLPEVQKRLHILEGFEKVYDALDEMIKIIRKSDGKEDAAAKLMKRFELDEIQTDAILDMRLYKLARLEILVVQKEAKEKRAEQKELKALLASDKARWGVVRDEIKEIAAQYKDERRTRIGGGREEVEYTEEAFIADADAHVVLTRDGWLKG